MKLDEITIPEAQELIALPPAKRAAVALKSEAAEAHLRELVAKTAAITNVVDKNGREEAHRAAMGLKNARVTIKNIGEEAREDAVAFQRAVVAEVARLAAITADEETRLFALRDAYDAKVAAEKAERERIEAERVAVIRAKIATVVALPVQHAGQSVTQLNAALQDLANRTTEADEFFEFTAEAIAAVNAAGQALVTMRNAAAVREQEEIERQRLAEVERQRVAAQAAELARLKAEQAERERVAAAEAAERVRVAQVERDKAEAERLAAAAREADLQRQLAEMKAQMEAQARAVQPQPDITVPDYQRSANGSDASTTIDVPLIVEGQPVTMGVDLAAPGSDMTADWLDGLPGLDEVAPDTTNTAPVRPDASDILVLLMTTYNADEPTVMGWLIELVTEQGL